MHAGGVLIAPGKLTDFCPLYTQGGGRRSSPVDKDDVESGRPGQVRLSGPDHAHDSRLGGALHPATETARAGNRNSSELRSRTAAERPRFLSLSDKATRSPCSSWKGAACKASEGRARPDRFEDIIALVALYRPGPMDLIPDFCDASTAKRSTIPTRAPRPSSKPTASWCTRSR